MHFNRMPLEDWFDRYQYEIDYDLGESGIKYLNVNTLSVDLGRLGLRYGYHTGNPELRTLISEQYEGFGPDQIAVTTGSSEANFAVIASLVDTSQHMIIEHPNYPSLYEVPRSLGLPHDLFELAYEENFEPNLGKLERLFKHGTKLVTLTHPNNPTGSVISEKMLREVIDLVESHDAYLLHDETYRDLSFDKPPPPAAILSDRAISMTTLSKAYGIPGARIGWIAGSKHIIESVRAVREQITICNNILSEAIASVALKQRASILKSARERVLRNFEILKRWISRQDSLEWVEPKGGVVAFPRLKNSETTEEICRLLVTKYRTFSIPGYTFGMDRYLRIGFGGDTEELTEGLERLKKAIEEYATGPRA
ncbi:MAG TPA: aminotransferase class I/II-fold pyridoxal phosphate-dependent enzyme [Candidatus Bathyarchaeia archaeon]|nr:aminotransferase class I/II-fold pyridoxal phosphate-dependent enzyme [Candidatus Bathyarchaeia archaeon]